MNSRAMQILKQLKEEEYVSISTLSFSLSVSERTVRNDIKELKAILDPQIAAIGYKKGFGYHLDVYREEEFNRLMHCSKFLNYESGRRKFYILEQILFSEKALRIDDFCEKLYVSRSTLNQDLKDLKRFLLDYNIDLEYINGRFKTVGNEFDIRQCIGQNIHNFLVMKHKIGRYHNFIMLAVTRILRDKKITLEADSLNELVNTLAVAIVRFNQDKSIAINPAILAQIVNFSEYSISAQIYAELVDLTEGKQITQAETAYISIHLTSKKTITSDNKDIVATVQYTKICEIVGLMLTKVKEYYDIDFTDDSALKTALIFHLIPLVLRIRFSTYKQNPILKSIKHEMVYAYNMAAVAAEVIVEKFKTIISEDELSYIALYFNLALERKKLSNVQKRILLVSSSGRSASEYVKYKLQVLYGSFISHIEAIDVLLLKTYDLNCIDCIIALTKIEYNVGCPVVRISVLFDEKDRKVLDKVFLKNNAVLSYFAPDLFIPSVNADSKEEIIRLMINRVLDSRLIGYDPCFLINSILERDRVATTELDSGVAFPHPNICVSKETFVCVAILDKPVLWNKQRVQLIWMPFIGDSCGGKLKNFYKLATKILLEKNVINKIIQNKSFDYFITLVKQINDEIEVVN